MGRCGRMWTRAGRASLSGLFGPRPRWRASTGRAAAGLVLLLIVLLALGWGAWWVWRARERYRAPLERGQALLAQRRLDEAIASFELARAARPDDPAPLRGLAACYRGKAQLDRAAAWAKEAMDLGDASPDSSVLAAEIALLRAGHWDPFTTPPRKAADIRLAEELARSTLEKHPDCGPAQRLLAEATMQMGDAEGAILHIRQALRLEPESRATRLTAADVCIRSGNPREALEHCRYVATQLDPLGELGDQERSELLRALSRAGRLAADLKMGEQAVGFWNTYLLAGGDQAMGHVGLLIGHYVKGDYAQAIEEGSRATRYITPTQPSWELRYYRGLSYLELKRYGPAAEDLRVAGTIRQDARAQYALGLALLRDGERGDARDAFVEAVQLDPRHTGALQELVALYEADGENGAALEKLRRAVAAAPTAREPREMLARFCLRHGLDADAEEALRALHQLKPPSASAAAALATFYSARDDPERALPLAREAMALEPASADFPHLAARLAADLGRTGEAIAHFEQALRLNPKRAEAYVDWAATLEAAGDQAGREEVLARARKALPSAPAVRCAYARFCLATGRVEEAIAEFRRVTEADRRDLAARTALVDHFLAVGEREEALKVAREAVDALPKSIEAQKLMARVHRARGDWQSLVLVLREAARLPGGSGEVLPQRLAAEMHEGIYGTQDTGALDPTTPQAVRRSLALTLAISRFLGGSRPEAIADAGRIASGDRQDCDAGFVLSLMQLAMNQPALRAPACRDYAVPSVALDAWRDLAQPRDAFGVEDTERDPRNLPDRGTPGSPYKELRPEEVKQIAERLLHAYVYERAGWPDAAAAEMERILKIAPDCLFACVMAPVLWERAGGRAKAIAACERAVAARKGFAYGRLLLGDLCLLDGKVDRAKALYAEAAKDEKSPFEAHTKLALVASLTGDEEGAIEAWRTIVRQQPRHMPACNNLAWLLATASEPQLAEAAAAAQNAFEVAGENPAALDTVGWVRHLRGERLKALEALGAAARLAPYKAMVQLHLGMAHALEGQEAEARKALTRALELAPQEPLADRARQALRGLRLAGSDGKGAGDGQ